MRRRLVSLQCDLAVAHYIRPAVRSAIDNRVREKGPQKLFDAKMAKNKMAVVLDGQSLCLAPKTQALRVLLSAIVHGHERRFSHGHQAGRKGRQS